jgi:peptidoglycan/LPS O-acetylase OafA/YrhL
MRFHALDALRGLAALSVVVYHCLLVDPALNGILGGQGTSVHERPEAWVAWLTLGPWRFLWAGREAVLLFFVLSGFVLTLPLQKPDPPPYLAFVAKRFCRLYLPFAASVALSGALMSALHAEPVSGVDPASWLAKSWTEMPTAPVVLRQLAFVGPLTLNNVAWSLSVEWYIGLVFPLLVGLVRWSWAGAVLLAFAAIALNLISLKALSGGEAQVAWYMLYFVLGAALAVHRERLCGIVAGAGRAERILFWLAAYGLLKARWLLPTGATAADVANGFGAALLIALVLTSGRAQALLEAAPFSWLGRISYSLYLVHVPVLLTIVHGTGANLAPWALAPLALGASLVIAHLFWHAVEAPAIRLGRALAQHGALRFPKRPGS